MNNHGATKCPMCGGNKAAGKTVFCSDSGHGVIVIRNVPATVCGQCGEAWLADATVTLIEAICRDAHTNNTEFEVRSLEA